MRALALALLLPSLALAQASGGGFTGSAPSYTATTTTGYGLKLKQGVGVCYNTATCNVTEKYDGTDFILSVPTGKGYRFKVNGSTVAAVTSAGAFSATSSTTGNIIVGNLGISTVAPASTGLQLVGGVTDIAAHAAFYFTSDGTISTADLMEVWNGNSVLKYTLTAGGAGVYASTVTAEGYVNGASAVIKWLTGAGSPEGAAAANVGSIYSRTNGAGGTSLYVKETGTGNTGWTALGTSGVTTMAAVGSSANANGASISGSTLTLQPASASFPGVMTAGSQTIAGNKTWNDFAAFQSTITANGGLTGGSSTAITVGSGGTLRFSGSSNNITETSGRYVMTASGADSSTAAYVFNTSSTYTAANPIYRFQNNGTDMLKIQTGTVTWNGQDFNNVGNFNGTGLGPQSSGVSPFIKSGSTAANGPNSDTLQTLSSGYLWAMKNNGTNKAQVLFDGSISQAAATLQTCASGIEGTITRDAASGGTTGHRTRRCWCTSDGGGTPAYAWVNAVTGTVGTTTTCPD